MLAFERNMMSAAQDVAWAEASGSSDGAVTTSSAVPPLGTLDEIAYQMTHGFWNGDAHRFNVTQGGSITVNLTGITADALPVARAALAVWTDIIGVNFPEVTTGGQIKFDDLAIGTGAFSESEWSNGYTTWATVNVSEARLGTGPGIMRGGLHTYIHEIGHALGLGHTAFANAGTAAAKYPDDALWRNDGDAISVMSYFDNGENTYYKDQGFTKNLVTTPMAADIIAIGNLYGLATITRTGDTTYGFNNNSGRPMFDAAAYPHLAYTIFDSGGVDTLDYSGFATNQRIDLNPEAFSNIGFSVGNVVIARGTVIENAIGGSGADTIIGNAWNNVLTGNAGNDILTGGPGADTFRGTMAGLNGDTITDLAAGDAIVFTNAALASFTFSLSGSTLSFSGGSLTLGTGPAGTLIVSAAAGGGVQLVLAGGVRNDFNGDGRSDILWRNTSGQFSDWLAQSNGSFVPNDGNAFTTVPTSWNVVGTGDFNGDGRSDVLWRNGSTGQVSDWLGLANGGFAINDANALRSAPTSWSVVGTGDFNGDGRSDVLWRNSDGMLSNWLGQPNGSFTPNDANAAVMVSLSWTVVGTGDFNGDGRDDILWRNASTGELSNWLANASGGFFANDANAFSTVPTEWEVVGTGDFNGDGRDDVLWRNGSTGEISDWLAQSNGGFVANDAAALRTAPTTWHVVDTGDYNGDGRDDVLWRSDSGQLSNWLGELNGSFVLNDSNALSSAPTDWLVQAPDNLFV